MAKLQGVEQNPNYEAEYKVADDIAQVLKDRYTAAEAALHLTAELKNVVARLWQLYERNEFLNDIQPSSSVDVYRMSLDDWTHMLAQCEQDWEHLVTALGKREVAARSALQLMKKA